MAFKQLAFGAGLILFLMSSLASACPFCTSVGMTFSEEIKSMDVAVLGELTEVLESDDEQTIPKATFTISKVIRGENWVKTGDKVQVSYYGADNRDRSYLLMGTDAPNLAWISPLPLSKRAETYIEKLQTLADDGTRLKFFQEHLEDEDEMLARDAYDEFARAPYKDVIALKSKMHRDRLLAWIQNTEIPASRRRLYFTMLGVCGSADDLHMLESMMKSTDRKQKAGLDALIACYLLLGGESKLPIIDDLFLSNDKAEYADTYSAIMAIRFHGNEATKIDKERLVKSLRLILERPQLADLVIPDLASWKDWEVMDRLVELFKTADEKSSWVRVPVVNYLRVCPLPRAKELIKELSEIDPGAVKRAQLIPIPGNENKPEEPVTTSAEIEETSQLVQPPVPSLQETPNIPSIDPGEQSTTFIKTTANKASVSENTNQKGSNVFAKPPMATAEVPNIFAFLAVPLMGGTVFFMMIWIILGIPFGHAKVRRPI